VSLYRPRAKRDREGDPRLWPGGIRKLVSSGELLAIAAKAGTLAIIPLRPSVQEASAHLGALADRLGFGSGTFDAVIERLRAKALTIQARGWIRAYGHGPKSVGDTFERELGLRRNSSKEPDFERRIEIKAKRTTSTKAGSGAGQLLTLFAKVPEWNREIPNYLTLVRKHGYWDEDGRKSLYTSVYTSTNQLGWRLRLLPDEGRLNVEHEGEFVVGYSLEALERAFKVKHPATIFVRASTRRDEEGELFHYDEAWLRTGGSFVRYLELLEDGRACMDFTAHLKPRGSCRNHGVLWRVQQGALRHLFAGEVRFL
jgi:hypothetical protein